MSLSVPRKVLVGASVAAISVLAVACSGVPQLSATTAGMRATLGGMSIHVPALPFSFRAPAMGQPEAKPATTTQSTLQGATHSGEGCPLALPQ